VVLYPSTNELAVKSAAHCSSSESIIPSYCASEEPVHMISPNYLALDGTR
jgi:hypothetical protein